jgi:hypothetical protein
MKDKPKCPVCGNEHYYCTPDIEYFKKSKGGNQDGNKKRRD